MMFMGYFSRLLFLTDQHIASSLHQERTQKARSRCFLWSAGERLLREGKNIKISGENLKGREKISITLERDLIQNRGGYHKGNAFNLISFSRCCSSSRFVVARRVTKIGAALSYRSIPTQITSYAEIN